MASIIITLDLPGVNGKLDQIITLLQAQVAEVTKMDAKTQASLDALNAAVAEQTTIETSVETLLTGLSAQIAALKVNQTDPAVLAAIDAAAAIVAADNAKTVAAVTANTPAA